MKWKIFAVILGVLLVCSLGVDRSYATSYTLSNNNSTAIINTTGTAMQTSWIVDGTQQLNTTNGQTFYIYDPYSGSVVSLNNLYYGASTAGVINGGKTLDVTYTGVYETVEVTWTLSGGTNGSGTSDLSESISISDPYSYALKFFEYTDFNLGGTASGDSAFLANANTMDQYKGAVNLAETTGTPPPPYWQINNNNSSGLLSTITGGGNLLNSNTGSYPKSTVGPGDIAWSFEWTDSASSYIISKDKHISPIPEPATMLLLGSGLIGLAGFARKKFKK